MGRSPSAMKCIFINLPHAEARQKAMAREFGSLGIEFEIFDAIDWRDQGEEDCSLVDRESREREGRRPLSDGMIACCLSHRKALTSIVKGEDELVTVFEDDVTLAPESRATPLAYCTLEQDDFNPEFEKT